MPAFLFKEGFLKGGDIIRQAKELAEPVVAQRGMELIDVEYMMEHGRWVLRFYIDKAGGVTVDDCGDVSEELGVILDVKDIIQSSYDLEVSSPGPDRPVTKENDFLKYAGRRGRIKKKKPIKRKGKFMATIDGDEE